jgi:DNA ligase-associated metallophosphoesterase
MNMADVSLSFCGQAFRPLSCGALFWSAESALLAADLHLEKGSSLARYGWMLPPYDSVETLRRLHAALCQTGANRLFLLGDSFHDREGPGRLPEAAVTALHQIARCTSIVWIAGNHDGLAAGAHGLPGKILESLTIAGIRLLHHPAGVATAPAIGGHFHPRATVPLSHGRVARRRCIALGPAAMILPAYGAYAGGLDISDPAIEAACAGPPTAVIATAAGIVQLPAASRRSVRKVA